MDLTLRPATPRDGPALRGLVFAIFEEFGLSKEPVETDLDFEDLEGRYSQRGGLFEVLEDAEGQVVGCVGLYPLEAGLCELRKMYLAPHCRGRGWGKRLLLRALEAARGLGFRQLRLETAGAFVQATALYEAHGFQRIPSDGICSRCDRAYLLELSPEGPAP